MSATKPFNVNKRIWFLTLICMGLFVVLVVRLVDLQILKHVYYESVAENQRKRAAELQPHRGTIYVSEGKTAGEIEIFPVATNQRAWWVYAVPRDMDDARRVADELAPELMKYQVRHREKVAQVISGTGQELKDEEDEKPEAEEDKEKKDEEKLEELKDELFDKFNKATDPYEPLLKPYENLDDEFKVWLEEKDIPGIVLEEREVRVYPEKSLASHVLGYVGYQDEIRVGRYGVEGYFEPQLAGSLGFLSQEQDNRGQVIGVVGRELSPAQNGSDIVLTIDRVVQSFIEDELKDGVEKYGAERGSILVMNPRTGAVLGMATYPTFDSNYYYAINEARVQLNPVVSDIFEPGSILKPLIMATAIEEDKVEPDTTMVDSGPVRVAEYAIDTYDSQHHGVQTMTQVLEQSNNVGMVWVGQQLGAETMYDYLRRFGLGERTGIYLEGETQTNLSEPNKWNVTTVATASFGQGVALTPLQALNGINVLANKGQLMQPRIVSQIRDEKGEIEEVMPTTVRQVISQETANDLSAMMVSVIENGVAQLARVPGYYLAGKTGTAQVADERGKYHSDKKIISFVGFGPVEEPQFSILIKLDNPSGLSFASGTAAPMFQHVAKKLLQYYQIPPAYND